MREKHLLSISSIALFLIAITGAIPTWAASPLASPGPRADMLQFKAGGHVLGFQPNKAYLASLDHALSVEFLGTPGVMPKAAAIPLATGTTPKAPFLSRVVYQNLWDGISLSYQYTKDGITESIYYLEPGADVSKIRLRYNVPVQPQKDGSLTFKFNNGFLTESAPVAWQEIGGKRVPVTVAFRVSNEEVGFRLGKYDPNQALIIDPTYAWHTFYGSPLENEEGFNIATDSAGNVYITGPAYASWSPAGREPLHAYSDSEDIFVLKLNSSGAYQWHAFYGGSGYDEGEWIAVDGDGNVYVTGFSTSAWTGLPNPINNYSSGQDIFVLKLDTNGAYQWHTFYGTQQGANDIAWGIATDISGDVYVTGHVYFEGASRIIIVKLNSSGVYQWSNLYASESTTNTPSGYSIAASGGNVYVTGVSDISWNVGEISPLHAHSGAGYEDIFVIKLNSSGTYQWHTFYGGSDDDAGIAIAVDGSENIYIAGYSHASWNGPAPENTPPINAFTASSDPQLTSDVFVLKLDSSGAYQWHTFWGTEGGANGISVDSGGNVYVAGTAFAHWTGPAGQPPLYTNDNGGIFVQKLASNGAYRWHVFYGTSNDYTGGISVNSGNVYIAGSSSATWTGPGGQLPLNVFTGGGDILVLKMAASGVVDFNGDLNRDILWRNTSNGMNAIWFMNGTTVTGFAVFDSMTDQTWEIVGTGDFNDDGRVDILWRNTSNGMNAVWFMDGTTVTGFAVFDSMTNQDWKIVGTGDFNNDDKVDILWRNTSNGMNAVWFMNGTTVTGFAVFDNMTNQDWQIVGR